MRASKVTNQASFEVLKQYSTLQTGEEGKKYLIYVDSDHFLGIREKGFSFGELFKDIIYRRSYSARAISEQLTHTFTHLENSWENELPASDLDQALAALELLNTKLSKSEPSDQGILRTAINSLRIADKKFLVLSLKVAIEENNREKKEELLSSMHSRGYFHEKEFRLFVASYLAKKDVSFLLENLPKLSLSDKGEILQVGFHLNTTDVPRYLERFPSINQKEAIAFYQEYVKNIDQFCNYLIGNGICFGYTLALLGEEKRDDLQTYSLARFIQAVFNISMQNRIGDVETQEPTYGSRIPLDLSEEAKRRGFLEIPRLDDILKTLHLKKGEKVFIDIGEISSQLINMGKQNPRGKFSLSIHSETQGHAIYMSFNPPSFCDTNYRDSQGVPALRTFSTIEEMAVALHTHIALTYPSYMIAMLTEYENNSTSSSILQAIYEWLQTPLF